MEKVEKKREHEKRTPQIETRLAAADFLRFDQLCRLDGKTKTEMARKAILYYMAGRDKEIVEEQENEVARQLKKMEDRMAAIMSRVMIDVGIVHQFLWKKSDEKGRDELFDTCYKAAVARTRRKLASVEVEVKELMKVTREGSGNPTLKQGKGKSDEVGSET